MQVGEVNAALKAHFEEVGAKMAQEWADKAGSRGASVLATEFMIDSQHLLQTC